ncbi:MAG: chromosomal replication initiator protein DnaA [Candidatus Sungbacteria bacterium]|nr:chromosomal replication initiator protein DnaA [Candidatus Sungbacteria bacterium]
MEKDELWHMTLAKIELDLSRPSFYTWFQKTSLVSISEGIAMVMVPNGFVKEWLENKYNKTILHALRSITPDIRDITYAIARPGDPESAPPKDHSQKHTRHAFPAMPDDALAIRDLTVNPITNLNPRYVFDGFIVGSFNELAYAAAQSVVKNLGTSYNPLFIYGGVGLGKTHMIQAVGNESLGIRPELKIRYVPAEKYMVEIVDALRNQTINQLKEKYRDVDVLIIDDMQFIARTEKMQEEFFHTFNALYERNKQIIISSDRPPHAIATLEKRLRSRFEGGMIADIGLPDLETRTLILKTKLKQKEASIPEEVVSFLAEKIKNNIRELEGALNRVVLAAKVSPAPFTIDAAKRVIVTHLFAPKKFVTPKKIVKAVSEFYDIEEKELTHRSRKKEVVKPRQIAMYLMREELKSSYPSIGEKFGGRDHTTAMHSCEKVAKDLQANPELEEEIQAIRERVFLA